MKVCVFERIYGAVTRVAKPIMEETEKCFRKIYPYKTYSCIYKQ